MVFIGQRRFVNGNLWSPLGVLIKCVHIWWKVCLCVCMPLFCGQLVLKCLSLYRLYLYVMYICWHVHVFLSYSTACVCVWQSMFTCAGELLGRRGEQQFVGHVTGPGTAGNARLLVAALHPVWQPLHVAVTVQRVGTQSPASQKESHRRVRTFLSHDDRKHSKVSTLTSESLFHFRFNVLNYRAKTKDVSLSKYCHTE